MADYIPFGDKWAEAGGRLDELFPVTMDPKKYAVSQTEGFDTSPGDYTGLLQRLRAQGQVGPRANPFVRAPADASRAAQIALLQQIGAQGGPGRSMAEVQGRRAMEQNQMRAASMGARGAAVGQVGNQLAQVGGGVAEEAAKARAIEALGAQAGAGMGALKLRERDIATAKTESEMRDKMRGLDAALVRHFQQLGYDVQEATRRAEIEKRKMQNEIQVKAEKQNVESTKAAAETIATIIKLIAG